MRGLRTAAVYVGLAVVILVLVAVCTANVLNGTGRG